MADKLLDKDLDGVPDSIDQCPKTPLLHEVNAEGCTTKILKLPEENDTTDLIFSLGYGYNTNEDLSIHTTQNISKLQLSFYHQRWTYTLKTSYYSHDKDKGMQDTILKIKKRFTINPALNINLGAGIKLPGYDYQGNKIDYIFYSSLYYYSSFNLSYFTGINYSFIRDDMPLTPLQNSYDLYLGSGYFFTQRLHGSLSYTYSRSKFKYEETFHTLSTSFYYKINKQFFTTLNYQRRIGDEDLHDGLTLKLGYMIW